MPDLAFDEIVLPDDQQKKAEVPDAFDEIVPAPSAAPGVRTVARTTGYYPTPASSPAHAMEGGYKDRRDQPIYTLDQYLRGEAPYVTIAGDPKIPYGTPATSPQFPGVPFRVNDTGGAFKGAGLSHFDIARDNATGANAAVNNRPAQFELGTDASILDRVKKLAATPSPPWLRAREQALLEDAAAAAPPPVQEFFSRAMESQFPIAPPFPVPNPSDNPVVATGKAAANLPAGLWNFMTSPAGAAVLPAGAIAPEITGAAFTAQQGAEALQPDLPTQQRAELILGAGLGALPGAHELAKDARGEAEALAATANRDGFDEIIPPHSAAPDFDEVILPEQQPTRGGETADASQEAISQTQGEEIDPQAAGEGTGGGPDGSGSPQSEAGGIPAEAEAGGGVEGQEAGAGPDPGGDPGARGSDSIGASDSAVAEPALGSAESGSAPGGAADVAAGPETPGSIAPANGPQTDTGSVPTAPVVLKSLADLPENLSGTQESRRGVAPAKGDGGFSENPLVQFVRADMGGIMSKSAAQRVWGKEKFEANKSLWDDAPSFPDPRHNKIYSRATGQPPDAVAAAAADAGLLPPGANEHDLFSALQKVADSAHRTAQAERSARANMQVAAKQARAFTAAIAKPAKGERPLSASDLQPGDQVKIGTETMKVKDVDPDTFDVTLEDGSKFGVQHVANNQVLYGELKPGKRSSSENDPFAAPGQSLPQLRPGEKGTAEMFQGADQPFNLAGETGIDHSARQAAAEKAAQAQHDAAVEAEKRQDVFGFGPGGASVHEPLGSHLATLTDYVGKELRGPRRPISVSGRIQRVIERIGAKAVTARESLGRVGDTVRGIYAATKDAFIDPVKVTEFKEAVKDWHYATSKREFEAMRWAHRMRDAIKDPLTEEAMTNYIQAGGDEALLRQRAAASNVKYRPGYEAALRLTEAQKTLAENVGQYHSAMLDDGVNAGILEHGVSNYIEQIWKQRNPFTNKLEADVQMGKLSTSASFARKRIFDSYFDGEQAGYAPANKQVGALVAHYDQAFGRALAARAFIKSLREAKAADGEPVVKFTGGAGQPIPKGAEPPKAWLIRSRTIPDDALTKDGRSYQVVDHPALRGWKWALTTQEGAGVFAQSDMLVHPDHAASLRNILGSSAFRTGKLRAFFSPLFRVQAIAKQTKLSLSAFHLTQEAVHALSHRVLPWNLPEINFDDPIQARVIRGGLQVVDFRAQELFQGGVTGGGLVTKIPALGKLQMRFNDWLFKDYIPRLKMKMAQEAYERNLSRYGPDTKTAFTPDQVAEITASQANAAFGEMNYKLLGRNQTMQDFLRIGVLAPDFLEARTRFIGQALKPYGQEQRVALMFMGAALYAGGRVLNQLLDDNPHWDKPFSVIHDNREYRLRTLVGDVGEILTDPRRFATNRMSPLTKLGFTWLTGRDYRGVKLSNWDLVKDTLSWMVPISAGGTEPMSMGQRLLGASGISNKPAPTPVDDAYQWALQWKEGLRDPKVQAEVRRARQETYASSDYKDLNRDLRDGDNEKAVDEMTRIMREKGKSVDTIEKYYDSLPDKPFTGSTDLEEQWLSTLDPVKRARYNQAVQLRNQMSTRALRLLPYAERSARTGR